MHSGMLDAFVKTVMGFLTSPAEAFKQVEGKTVGAAYQYYAMLVLIFSILFGAVTIIMGSIMLNSHVQEIAMLPLIGSVLSANLAKFGTFIATTQLLVAYVVFLALLFGVFFVGFFLHMFVLLMDGKKSIWETVKTTMFASTPLLLIGWIPYIGVIGASLVFCIGDSRVQGQQWSLAGKISDCRSPSNCALVDPDDPRLSNGYIILWSPPIAGSGDV